MNSLSEKQIPLTPAVQRGYDFIRAQIASNAFKEGDSLPSINDLAKLAGISRVTMWKALKLLKEDGILWGHHSHNYSVPISGQSEFSYQEAAQGEANLLQPKKALVERIADRIKEDMIVGRFSNANTLPSLKELQELYGVSYPTMRKTLSLLVEQQFLHVDRRKFAVSSHKRKKRSMRIELCGFTHDGSTVMHGPLIGGSILREIETECSRQNIALYKQAYSIENGELVFPEGSGNLQKIMSAQDTAGFINLIIQPFALSEELIFQLSQTRKPVAILDGAGGWMLPRTSFTRQTIRIFNYLIGSNCGVQAARYLLDHGHRHIAYVSPYDKALWSQTRLKGLQTIFESSSQNTSVEYYCLEGTKAARDYIGQSIQHGNIEYLKTHFDKWAESAPREFSSHLKNLPGSSNNESVASKAGMKWRLCLAHPVVRFVTGKLKSAGHASPLAQLAPPLTVFVSSPSAYRHSQYTALLGFR